MNKKTLIICSIIYLQIFIHPTLSLAQCSPDRIEEAYDRCIREQNDNYNFSELSAQGDCNEEKYKVCSTINNRKTPTVDNVCPAGVNDPGGRCDDGNPCTQDVCQFYSYGQCFHYPIPECGVTPQESAPIASMVCQNDNPCMEESINEQGECELIAKPDGIACIFDPATGHPLLSCRESACTEVILQPLDLPPFTEDEDLSSNFSQPFSKIQNPATPANSKSPYPGLIQPIISWVESWLS